jgi:hypothetical protein
MKILAIEKVLLEKEANRVYELYKQDKIREIYFHKKNHIALVTAALPLSQTIRHRRIHELRH